MLEFQSKLRGSLFYQCIVEYITRKCSMNHDTEKVFPESHLTIPPDNTKHVMWRRFTRKWVGGPLSAGKLEEEFNSFARTTHIVMIQGWWENLQSFPLRLLMCAHKKYESNHAVENKTVRNELPCSLGKEGKEDKEKVTTRIEIAK